MLTRFDSSYLHQKLYKEFQHKLGFQYSDGRFEDPFEYYKSSEFKQVDLWLLIIEKQVVASVITKKQTYYISGEEIAVYFLKYPVSLGTVLPEYAHAAIYLVSSIKKQFEYSFLLGMGGSKSVVAKFFSSARYTNIDIPFYVKPISYSKIILHNPLVKKIISLENRLNFLYGNDLSLNQLKMVKVDEITSSEMWRSSSFSLDRRPILLNSQTPTSIKPFIKFEFLLYEKKIAHIIVFETSPHNHRYFGDINIWTILDLEISCSKKYQKMISKLLILYAKKRGVNILLANSGSDQFKKFCKDNSWFNFPSNFCLSLSPKLSKKIQNLEDVNITRLDGDGPINLGFNF